VYGLGSRDFRPEHIIGAYEYVAEGRKRQDGKGAADGVTFFYLGCSPKMPGTIGTLGGVALAWALAVATLTLPIWVSSSRCRHRSRS